MDAALQQLMKRMPPPTNPPFSDVDWERVEGVIKLRYPSSFKEFIGAYGSSIWFDNLSAFYCSEKFEDPKQFLTRVELNLEPLRTNMYDERFNRIELPLYPESGGLFPFLVDYSSNLFCWRTEREDPNKWPVVFWNCGPIITMEKMTIAKMILEWLERKARMVRVWGTSIFTSQSGFV